MTGALDCAGVARALGHTVEWFYVHRAELEQLHGFPKPLPGCGLRWDAEAVARWKLGGASSAAAAPPASTDELEVWRARLDARVPEVAARLRRRKA